ncbi:hypothetical protein Tco_0005332 [Tanacetum coccineum]
MFGVNDLEGDEVIVETEVDHEVVVETKVTSKDVNLSVDEVTLAQALASLKSAKPKADKVQDKGKGIMEEPEKPTKKKDQIRHDEEVAQRLQAQMQAELEEEDRLKLSIEEKSKLFVQLLEARKKHFAAIRAKEKRNKPPTKAQKRNTIHMLKSFDKEDLETLWKLEKAKHGSTRLEEGYKRVLWGDLKTMFNPHVEDQVWRNQQDYKVLDWKIYDSCGVHSLRMQHMHIHMLVEKRYPLTPAIITDMLNKKLQCDHFSEMGRIVGIKRLHDDLEVTAAKVCVTDAKLNTASVKLVLLVKIEENILSSYYCLYTVNVTTGAKLLLLVLS